jgi:hypothetical protein
MDTAVIVWDIESTSDLERFAAAQGFEGKSQEEVREALGDKFPKALYHSIVCIGALVARPDNGKWVVGRWVRRTRASVLRSF